MSNRHKRMNSDVEDTRRERHVGIGKVRHSDEEGDLENPKVNFRQVDCKSSGESPFTIELKGLYGPRDVHLILYPKRNT